ncbi:cupin domain-containing protein [Novosphingobium sp. Fuku2-ISO-50]|uniref:cupin domain-containing protein n=1 Tax=Novosphingobium sp. Fuku2-ISO-50 TaxID=1739114 RepID=UPI00076C0203|nr:cupin domain-containing protein [Novosphingobium sp. Fuku2-ISO-50]KUR77929.1 cupin [Novosphingobium sp. Fuku2-ISO-50]
MTDPRALIERLGLIPHPEGGWYSETWRAEAAPGTRAAGTLIHFLLESGQSSHWHRVDADEIWLWQGGDRIELAIAADAAGPARRIMLGPDPLAGDLLQAVVPAGQWQAAVPLDGAHGHALVSCVVVPGFDFAGFELAAPGWRPGT